MKRIYVIAVPILLFITVSCGQGMWKKSGGAAVKDIAIIKKTNIIETMSQAEMFEDFNYLVKNLNEKHIMISILKDYYNYDVNKEFDKLRNTIQFITNKKDFIILVYRALVALQEHHCPYAVSHLPYISAYSDYEKAELKKINNKYHCWVPNYYMKIKIRLPILYYNGEYVVYKTFTNANTVIPKGATVLKIDGQPVSDYIRTLLIYKYLNWDSSKKVFYDDYFYLSDASLKNSKFSLTFKAGKNTLQSEFDSNQKLQKIPKKEEDYPKIFYFTNIKTLYIRFPKCNDTEYYKKNIPLYKTNDIKKVIVDIRGNQGGIPLATFTLISYLIGDPFTYSGSKVVLHQESNYSNYKPMSIYNELASVELNIEFEKTLKILKNILVDILDFKTTIFPSPEGLNYPGIIYLIHDKDLYSSGIVFMNIGLNTDKILTVGMPLGWPNNGMGGGASFDTLPNSKYLYGFILDFDVSDIKNSDSVYHNEVEQFVPYTFDETVYRETNDGDLYSPEYLTNKDSLVKWVLQQK
ncbi:MAG: hypothetical protein A2014_08875 [Spirochaetes bacterium GWF1_49_6]|nr:MAG: hypothetical protein A2014_08875 [Spirochaetes bacterium GWF1_49_6]